MKFQNHSRILLTIYIFIFMLISNCYKAQCNYTIDMQDSFGDGWNGASIDVEVNEVNVANITVSSGSSGSESFTANTGDNVDLLASSNIGSDTVFEAAKANGYIDGYLTGDGIAANGNSAGFGTSFPTYPVKDQLFLRTDYVPQRLFKFDGKRFVKVEDNVRLTLSNKTNRTGGKFGFINNTTETTRKDGTTYKERVSLSEIMKPREDN